MLQIYNSLVKEKEAFKPIEKNKVRLYVCGMTVYDYCHLGHARVVVCFDNIYRHLCLSGYDVNYVRNITDIDDKIIRRAHEKKQSVPELTHYFTEAMHQDMAQLNCLPATKEPKATGHIQSIIDLIHRLLEKKVAYIADNNDVYFDITRFENYGRLANKDLMGQEAGARIGWVDAKHHPLDFVLWKQAKPDEPSWPSPWGDGRPGWHIECSAMSMHCLGEQIDIHGGGFDLQFPHHENEIAQSEAATGHTFVNYWMHVGYLQINREKMSKSSGNFFTIRDVLKCYPSEVVRYFLLSSHYRSQLNYSKDNLDHALASLQRLYLTLRKVPPAEEESPIDNDEWSTRFKVAMDDDFNVPEALAVLFELTHLIHRVRETEHEQAQRLSAVLKRLSNRLGLLEQDPDDFFQGCLDPILREQILDLIKQREHARESKNWEQADRLRDQLNEMGVELEDEGKATLWRVILV